MTSQTADINLFLYGVSFTSNFSLKVNSRVVYYSQNPTFAPRNDNPNVYC